MKAMQELVARFEGSRYFSVVQRAGSEREVEAAIKACVTGLTRRFPIY
jgi:hypothetical protein